MTRQRSVWLWAVVASVVLHALIVVYFVRHRASGGEAGTDGGRVPATVAADEGSAAASDGDGAAPAGGDDRQTQVPPARARAMLETAADRARAMDGARQMAQLVSESEQLARIPPERMVAMSGFMEAAMGLADVELTEPDAEAAGAFDATSATLYDIDRRGDEAGSTSYRFTLVDGAGRTLVNTVPAEAMSQESLRLYETFELGRKNPGMRVLIDIVRKMAVKEMQEDSARR